MANGSYWAESCNGNRMYGASIALIVTLGVRLTEALGKQPENVRRTAVAKSLIFMQCEGCER